MQTRYQCADEQQRAFQHTEIQQSWMQMYAMTAWCVQRGRVTLVAEAFSNFNSNRTMDETMAATGLR